MTTPRDTDVVGREMLCCQHHHLLKHCQKSRERVVTAKQKKERSRAKKGNKERGESRSRQSVSWKQSRERGEFVRWKLIRETDREGHREKEK